MHRRRVSIFLTFVLIAVVVSLSALVMPSIVVAATQSPSPDFQEPAQPSDFVSSSEDEALRQTIDIAPAPPMVQRSPDERTEFYYRYRKSLTARLGSVYSVRATDGKNVLTLIGAEYMFPSQHLESFEAGADLLSDGSGAMHIAKRFEFSRVRFRPYWKAGGGLRIVPSEQLVSFVKLGNYQLRAAAGFEQLAWIPQSVRLEVEAALSTADFKIGLALGYVWAW